MMTHRHKPLFLVLTIFIFLLISVSTTSGNEQKTRLAKKQYNQLMDQLNQYYQAGEFDKALATAEQAVELAIKVLGADHPLTTSAVFTLAQLYQAQGLLQKAETQFLKLLKLYQQTFDAGELDKAIARESLASVYLAQGRYKKAEQQYLQVLKTKTETLGAEHPEVSFSTSSLAELYRLMGHYDKSEPLFEKAIAQIREQQGDQNPGLYSVLANQAKLFEDLGQYVKSEKIYLQVWRFDQKSLGEKHPNTVIDLNNLAGVYRKQGYYRQAEESLLKVLADSREVFGDVHPQSITALNNLALLYENLGLYEKAEPYFINAIRDAKTTLGVKHPKTIKIMNNLALLHESQGLFDKAEPLYLRAIELSISLKGVDHPDTVAIKNNLGFLYMVDKKYNKADEQFQAVSKIWQKQLGLTHQKTLKAMNNLARAKHGLGRHREAEALFRLALKTRQGTLGPQHPDSIRSMIDLAALYKQTDRLQEAKQLLQEALSLAESNLGDKHPYTFEALNGLADVYEKAQDPEKAIDLREIGFNRRSEFLNRILWSTGENTRQSYIRLHKPEQDLFLRLLVKMNTPETARMALHVSLQRKGLLLKIASEIHKVVSMSGSPELYDLTDILQEVQKQLAALTLSGPAGESAELFQKKLLALEDKRNEVQGKLGRASQPYRNSSQQVSVDDVLDELDVNTALVDFLAYTDKRSEIVAVIATKDSIKGARINLVTLGKQLIIKQAISEYRSMIQEEETEDDELLEAGRSIYKKIWKPLKPFLKNKPTVYIVPDSIIHLLPIDTLIDENNQYLLKSKDLRILSSSRDLVVSSLPPAQKNLLIFAGPDYDIDNIKDLKKEILDRRGTDNNGIRLAAVGLRSLSFGRLIGAELEGTAIKKVSDRLKIVSTIYSQRKAEERQLRRIKKPPQIIHIATHGFFLKPEESMIRRLLSMQRGARNRLPPPGDNPLLRAGLAFAGINANAPFLGDIDTNNDGILTALEALKLNLSGTELVVLSACETGVGEIHAGEGVYGLRRAFQEAGVKSVLNSLWPVSDEGTRVLMVGFYNEMLAGKSVREALKASQLSMLEGEWKHPYYWAAFVVVGRK